MSLGLSLGFLQPLTEVVVAAAADNCNTRVSGKVDLSNAKGKLHWTMTRHLGAFSVLDSKTHIFYQPQLSAGIGIRHDKSLRFDSRKRYVVLQVVRLFLLRLRAGYMLTY